MSAFLTFIFYFFLTLFLLGLIGRIALRLWLRRLYKKMSSFSENQPGGFADQSYNQPKRGKRKMIDKTEGEYIDYEEMD